MATTSTTPSFRGDIDGLRGIAILLVVGFHCELLGFEGGFVGVDVFFVISGYLITRILISEVGGSGTVSLRQFWAKRIRRLVPALTTMVMVVLVLGMVILSPLEWGGMARDGAASILYVSNLVFASQSDDYFGATESIFLHTWSLSVEEQFYLVWPVLLIVAASVARRAPRVGFRTLLGVLLVAMSVGSFAVNVVLAEAGTPWAFYSLPTRMWEFGIAGLLALADPVAPIRRRWAAEALALAGLAAIGAATLLFDGSIAYPGIAALLPVLGTALVIRAGSTDAPSTVGAALGSRPLQAVGRISYSWYLWHWPLILLAVAAVGRDAPSVRVAGALIGLGIGWLALRFLENPIRFSPRLRASLGRTYVLGAAASIVALATAFVTATAGARISDRPFYRAIEDARAWEVDSEGRPSSCTAEIGVDGSPTCVLGRPDAERTIIVAGDSHALHWAPALDRAGEELGVRIIVRTYGNCPAIDVPITDETGPVRPGKGCERFRSATADLIESERPDAVVVANATYLGRILDGQGDIPDEEGQLEVWEQAYDRYLADLEELGIGAGIILATPVAPVDPLDCVARAGSAAPCSFDRAEATEDPGAINEVQRRSAERAGSVALMDVTDAICADERCRVQIDGDYVYRDRAHLTDAFTSSQATAVEDLLEAALGGS